MASVDLNLLEPCADELAPTSRRTLANRRNALKSTGPRTPEGKAISRRNALKTGLSGDGVVLPVEVEEDARARTRSWIASYQPTSDGDRDLIEMAAISLTRLHHCWREESATRARMIERADGLWDIDREQEVAKIAARLSSNPLVISTELRTSAHGAAWMLEEWTALAGRIEAGADWDEASRSHALDLLGVTACFRDQHSPVDRPDAAENPDALREQRLAVAQEQIESLAQAIDHFLLPVDDSERELIRSNLFTPTNPALTLFRRYERGLSNKVLRIMSRMRPGLVRSTPQRGSSPARRDETNPSLLHATNVPGRRDVRVAPPIAPSPTHAKASFYETERAAAARDEAIPRSRVAAFTNTSLRSGDKVEMPSFLPPEFANLSLDELSSALMHIPTPSPEQVDELVMYMRARTLREMSPPTS